MGRWVKGKWMGVVVIPAALPAYCASVVGEFYPLCRDATLSYAVYCRVGYVAACSGDIIGEKSRYGGGD